MISDFYIETILAYEPNLKKYSHNYIAHDRKQQILNPRRKHRTNYSYQQLKHLELEFQQSHYLATNQRRYLAWKLQLKEDQIKVWFQNRRTKWKREHGVLDLESFIQTLTSRKF